MNIAILHYSVQPVVGGVESVIAHHARMMSANGHSVRLIAARGEAMSAQIPLITIPLADSRHVRVAKMKEELDRGEVTQEFEVLRAELAEQLQAAVSGVDILIVHNICSLNKNLALTAALYQLHIAGKLPRLILWHHDLAWTTPRYQFELHEGYPWDLLKTAWIGAAQVTISEMRQEELSDLMKIEQSAIRVIPNGVDMGKFLKLEEQTLGYIKKLDLLLASPLLLLPVRITSRKNIELALQILAVLRIDLPSAQIIITGPLGPHNPANLQYFEKLSALREDLGLKNSAHFLAELTTEFIPDRVISDFYKLADALLFPSFEEGFGIPILEAGFAGIPVFCSDIPPLKKLGGVLVNFFSPQEDPAAVAKMITTHFMNNKVFGLRKSVREQFTWERIHAEKIAPLLKE
ncbi:glycosyltransferase family 4 protein [Candidatus Villigracilis saccharophilus]|uniref:glycosyltransferase family 4 protein n=1 Tax=Candidatus Villigracilis saccharophilus TaxID=3140684 RepID=UPI0031361853|nr:glycosyltransferase family 4 protein [Anaerolineales bacterium]